MEIVLGSNYFGEPEFNIRLKNRVEYTSENSIFQMARRGDVNGMKRTFDARLASPNDLSLRGGLTAYDVRRR